MKLRDLQFEVNSQISSEFIRRHMQINMQKLEEEARNLIQARFFIEAVIRCGGWLEIHDEHILICDDGDNSVSDEMIESFKCLWPYVLYIFNEQDLEEYGEEDGRVETFDSSRGGWSS